MGDETVGAESRQQNDNRKQPEDGAAQHLPHSLARRQALVVPARNNRPVAHQQRRKRKSEQSDATEREVRFAPAVAMHHRLHDLRNDDGAGAAAR